MTGKLRFWFVIILAHCGVAKAVNLTVQRLANGQVVVSAPAASAAVNLEWTSDLHSWAKLQTFAAGAAINYSEPLPTGRNFFRLTAVPAALADLGALKNQVFPAPESLSTVQFAPNGNLAFVAWRDQTLIVRERATSGAWTESVLNSGGNIFQMLTQFVWNGPRQDYAFQPSAALVFDAQSRPHVFQATGTSIIHYAKNTAGVWGETERINDPKANASIATLEVGIGAGDVLHFAALSSGSPRNLTYGSNRGGSWTWTTISSVTDSDPTYWAPGYAPRWLSLAIDAGNNAHIAYRSSMDISRDAANHPRAYSILKYASNKSGAWVADKVVQAPFDNSGEAANGASIAIAPDSKPRIVSWYNERADSGSAQESRLYFHQQDANGNWSGSVIFTSADGYAAGDGNKGTGFSPYLRFDNAGRAHIVFLDHAGEHFGGVGQQEYAGNLRHAWLNGSTWSVETLADQTNPLLQQMVYPAFAMSNNEIAVTYLERNTQWNLNVFPPMSNSAYYFRFIAKSLP